MAAARWQKCVYVHKSRIFADIPHPLCVSKWVLCAPDFMNISFELEREIVVQWKGLSYLNIFTARHHHSIPSLPLSGLLVHCRIRATGVCVCVCHVLAWTWKKNYVRIETMGSKNVCKASIHISHTHIWSVPAFWWMTFYRTQNLCSYFRSGTKDMQAFASYWLAAIDDSNYIMHTQAVSVIFTFGHCPFFPFATKTEPLALFLFRSFTFRISVCLFAHQQLECIPKIA